MIIALIGKSASGKDSIIKRVSKELNLPVATSFTTRPMRKGEKQGVEYNFISKEEFTNKLQSGEIAESTSYNVADGDTWYYGLETKELQQAPYVLAIVNPDGLEQLSKLYKGKLVSILIDSDPRERLLRTLNRDANTNIKELCRRFLADEQDFENVLTDYIVYNDDLEKAIQDVKNIIVDEMMEECL